MKNALIAVCLVAIGLAQAPHHKKQPTAQELEQTSVATFNAALKLPWSAATQFKLACRKSLQTAEDAVNLAPRNERYHGHLDVVKATCTSWVPGKPGYDALQAVLPMLKHCDDPTGLKEPRKLIAAADELNGWQRDLLLQQAAAMIAYACAH